MASFHLKVIRGAFGVGERLSPAVAGWAAFELFCRTPGPSALTKGEKQAIAQASGFMQEARHHHLNARTGLVFAHEFRPAGGRERLGTVLVVHGWRSRTEYMRSIVEGLREAGFRVVSLDLPGHGWSPGRKLDMAKAVDAVETASQWFGPFSMILGHSFGGAVAVNAAVGSIAGIPPVRADRLVLISAPESLPGVFEKFGRFVNVGPRSQQVIAGRVERIAGRPLGDFLGAQQLARLPVPTLVIHAADDKEVSAESARRYASAGAHVRVFWADGLGHRRILSSPLVVDQAVAFARQGVSEQRVH